MIVGLSGLSGSGKDTVAAYLIKEHQFERIAFADKVKQSIARTFDIPFREVEQLKDDDTVYVALGYKNQPQGMAEKAGVSHMWSPIRELTFGEFMQYFATEGHRDVFGQYFWVEQCLPVDGFYAGRKIVVTDVRFREEADRIRVLGGSVVKIVSPVPHKPSPRHNEHVSEVQSDLGYIAHRIDNNGTIDDLMVKIEEMLANLVASQIDE